MDSNTAIGRIGPVDGGKGAVNVSSAKTEKTGASSFGAILEREVKFSAHASKRLEERNIDISVSDMQKIETAVEKAAKKGSRESLLLMEDIALIVSIPNRTVITAVDNARLKENVFTNIDSAIVL